MADPDDRRISARLTESRQFLVSDPTPRTLSEGVGPPEELVDGLVHRLIVIAPTGSAADDVAPLTEAELKYSGVMAADSRPQRTRITDLGTIDLDPEVEHSAGEREWFIYRINITTNTYTV